ATYRIKSAKEPNRGAWEITHQIDLSRRILPEHGKGHLHFSMKSLVENRDSICQSLAKSYLDYAIPPPSPWLGTPVLGRVSMTSTMERDDQLALEWKAIPPPSIPVRWWYLQTRERDTWRGHPLLPGATTTFRLDHVPEAISIRAIGPTGAIGPAHWHETERNLISD
ncbi:MAG: hypothetical protein AAF191_16140, partial [Verrucomicrobiota bacterium]